MPIGSSPPARHLSELTSPRMLVAQPSGSYRPRSASTEILRHVLAWQQPSEGWLVRRLDVPDKCRHWVEKLSSRPRRAPFSKRRIDWKLSAPIANRRSRPVSAMRQQRHQGSRMRTRTGFHGAAGLKRPAPRAAAAPAGAARRSPERHEASAESGACSGAQGGPPWARPRRLAAPGPVGQRAPQPRLGTR